MVKSKILKLVNCNFKDFQRMGPKFGKPFELECLGLSGSQIDICFTAAMPLCLAKLKDLRLLESSIDLPGNVRLDNL